MCVYTIYITVLKLGRSCIIVEADLLGNIYQRSSFKSLSSTLESWDIVAPPAKIEAKASSNNHLFALERKITLDNGILHIF